jgi:uncharacterized caspase-like protein
MQGTSFLRPRLELPLCAVALTSAIALLSSSCAQSATAISSSRYALIYGIENYPSGSLSYPVDDAQGIRDLLVADGLSSNNIIEREDSSVTKAQIKADILSLASVASDSTVIVYYSGHGTFVTKSWGSAYYPTYSGAYIVPYDALSSSGLTSSSAANLVSPTEIQEWIAQMGTKNVILIMDSCYSGAFVDSGSSIDSSPDNYADMESYSAFSTALANFGDLIVSNAKASGDKAPIVLSACGSDEYSYDGTTKMGHGVFTYYLLQSATSGDSDGDGFLTTTEAYAYTSTKIKTWGSSLTNYSSYSPFLPHISGGTRDLVLLANE